MVMIEPHTATEIYRNWKWQHSLTNFKYSTFLEVLNFFYTTYKLENKKKLMAIKYMPQCN